MKYPTQNRLKELFEYCQTGQLIRKKTQGGEVAGTFAGWMVKNNYKAVSVDNITILAHRAIWILLNGDFEGEIDHINHDASDNRIENLRVVTKEENLKNKKKYKSNSSGFTGVSWSPCKRAFVSYISVKGKLKSLGSHKTFIDAVAARKKANIEYGFHKNHGML